MKRDTEHSIHDPALYRLRICAAVRRANDDLLVLRESSHGQECSVLPGGTPKFGESLEQAVVREVYEETGYHILPTEIAYVVEHRAERWSEPALEICFYADLVHEKSGGSRDGEYIRSIDWRSLNDPELRSELSQIEGFTSSRKGRYLEMKPRR